MSLVRSFRAAVTRSRNVATRRATQSRSTTWATGSTHFSYGWSNRNYSTGGERKQYKHPEEEEYSEDPVDNLPPELQDLEPMPKSVWAGILISSCLVVAAVPWVLSITGILAPAGCTQSLTPLSAESIRDHIFFPPDDEDD